MIITQLNMGQGIGNILQLVFKGHEGKWPVSWEDCDEFPEEKIDLTNENFKLKVVP